MWNALFVIAFFQIGLCASSVILQNQYVKTSVSENGTLGNGTGFPGMQFDASGSSNFRNDTDYLQPDNPWEFFSLHIDGTFYCNNNNDGTSKQHEKKCTKMDVALKNISSSSVEAITYIKGLEVIQRYSIPDKRSYIKVEVTIQNTTDKEYKNIFYARGLDPDSGNRDSYNYRGYTFETNTLKKTDVLFTKSKANNYPIGMYTNSTLYHNTSLLYPWEMDPSLIIQGLEQLDNGDIHGDQTINIAFKIDRIPPNAKQAFVFLYFFGENPSKIMTEITEDLPPNANIATKLVSALPIPYKHVLSHEFIGMLQFSATSNDKKKKKSLVHFSVDNIPEGLMIQIGDNNLTHDNTKTTKPLWIFFDDNRSNQITLYRNHEYKSSRESKIGLTVEDVNASDSTWLNNKVTIPIQPKERNISIIAEGIAPTIPLNQIDELNEIAFKLIHDGIELSEEEFAQSDLDIDIDGLNYILEKDEEHLNYKLKLKPEIPLCLTAVGDVKVHLEIDNGYYPGDYGSLDFVIHIEDVSWWDKCKNTIFTVLATLFTLWYIVGMIKKNRFSKSIRLERYDYDMREQEYKKTNIMYYLRQRRGLLWALVPYINEKQDVNGMTFIATNRKNSVRIDRNSLVDAYGKPLQGIKINGISIVNSLPAKYGKIIETGSMISIGEDKRYELKS